MAARVEGTRNHTLNRAALALGQLIGADAIDAETVAAQLLGFMPAVAHWTHRT